jgi:hypothetical protein
MKICTQCRVEKDESEFGWSRGSDKKPGTRKSKCRPCYNAIRRAHYHKPEVNAEKNRIRRLSEASLAAKEKRQEYRARTEVKLKTAEAQKRYKSKPEVQEARRKKREENIKRADRRSVMLMNSVNVRCRKGNLPVEIDAAWIKERLEKGVCEVSGVCFEFGKHGSTRRNPFGPSIDQIVAGGGYTLKNSRVVLTALNLALCEWGVDTYVQIAQAVLRANGFSVERMETISEQSLQFS